MIIKVFILHDWKIISLIKNLSSGLLTNILVDVVQRSETVIFILSHLSTNNELPCHVNSNSDSYL